MKRKYESEAMQVLYEEWLDMHRSGLASDEEMRKIDELCFGKEDETGPKAKKSPKKKPATA